MEQGAFAIPRQVCFQKAWYAHVRWHWPRSRLGPQLWTNFYSDWKLYTEHRISITLFANIGDQIASYAASHTHWQTDIWTHRSETRLGPIKMLEMSQSKNQHCLVFHLLEHQLSSKDLNFSELSLEEFLSKWLEMWGCCSDGWRKLAESALLTWMSSREKSKFKTFQNSFPISSHILDKYLEKCFSVWSGDSALLNWMISEVKRRQSSKALYK